MPLNEQIPLAAVGQQADTAGRLAVQQQQQQQRKKLQADIAVEEHKEKLNYVGSQSAVLYDMYQKLPAAMSEEGKNAALNAEYQRIRMGAANARLSTGKPMFSQQDMQSLPEQTSIGEISQTMAQIIGATKFMEQSQARATAEQKTQADKQAANLDERKYNLDVRKHEENVRLRDFAGNTARMRAETYAQKNAPIATSEELDAAATDPAAQKTILSRVDDTYGPVSVAKDFMARTLGNVWGSTVNEDVVRGRSQAGQLKQQLLEAFAISGRPAVVEQERILEFIPSTGVFESPARAKISLDELSKLLHQQVKEDQQYVQRRDLTNKERQETRERIRAVQNVIRNVGVSEPVDAQAQTQNAVPTGISQEEWNVLTPEEQAKWPK